MSNHFHVVVRNHPDVVETLSDDAVARRWWHLCPKGRDQDGKAAVPTEVELKVSMHPKRVVEFRRRLSDISWFMRALAEPIAPILQRLGLSREIWCDVVKHYGKIFQRVAGTPESLAREAESRN